MKILGIETSCDETAAAIVENGTKILSNIIASSKDLHKKTGGIVPEVAAREQIKCIVPVLAETLGREFSIFNFQFSNVDAIAVTVGPGLIGSLLIGVETAKTLAYIWQKPIVPVNHLIGHIYGNFVAEVKSQKSKVKSNRILLPSIVLIVSGGHTELVLMKNHGNFSWLGGTRDDAAGEAFDKVAKLLGLGYPGGPAIQKVAENGDPTAFDFPRPMIKEKNHDFSFSGLKTAVLYKEKEQKTCLRRQAENKERGRDMAASFQQAAVDVLVAKTILAAKKYKVKSILLAGGVAANKLLRETLTQKVKNKLPQTTCHIPPTNLCTDNAAMIASTAYFNYKPVLFEKILATPNLSIE